MDFGLYPAVKAKRGFPVGQRIWRRAFLILRPIVGWRAILDPTAVPTASVSRSLEARQHKAREPRGSRRFHGWLQRSGRGIIATLHVRNPVQKLRNMCRLLRISCRAFFERALAFVD